MADFVMPSLGADMTAGTLARWRVAPGDRVKQGDIIAEVETDKGIIEVEVFESGTVKKLLVTEGEKVPVGTTLAEIDADAGADTAAAAGSRAGTAKPGADAPPSPEGTEEGLRGGGGWVGYGSTTGADTVRPMASPAVRRRAHELGVSLSRVQGSGEHGRITLDDVVTAAALDKRLRVSPYARRLAAERGVDVSKLRGTGPLGAIQARDVLSAEPSATASAASATERMQRAIAAAMTRANDEIPHYYVEQTIDMGSALDWLREANASVGVGERLVPGVLVLRAVALALRKHRSFNAVWKAGVAEPIDEINVGLAVSLRGGGLVAPALRHTDDGSLLELMARMTDLVARARAGNMRSSELTSATITLTALGERGVEGVIPIIFPPQVAIIGCGAIVERPWVVDGAIVARPVMRVTLGADHRVSNGHQGGRFLRTLDRLLQEPGQL